MPRNLRLLLIITSLIIAACGGVNPPPPVPEGAYDWCYVFDFTESDYGAIVSAGRWVEGSGFMTPDGGPVDVGGQLSIVYTHPNFVEPYALEAQFHFRNNEILDIPSTIAGSMNIFGIEGELEAEFPPEFDDWTANLGASEPGIAGTTAFISLESDAEVTISSLIVSGYGGNPFPTNGCAAAATPTGTPFIFPSLTPTPTYTPTATNTPTATYTPSPTSTPLDDWTCVWDFSISDGGWEVRQEPDPANNTEAGQYDASGGYWESSVVADVFETISISIPTTYSYAGDLSVLVQYEYLISSSQSLVQWRDAPYGSPTTGGQADAGAIDAGSGSWSESFSDIENVDFIRIFIGSDPGTGSEHFRIHRITISGSGGTIPFAEGSGIDCVIGATPTPTTTPNDATATAEFEGTATAQAQATSTSNAIGTATAQATITPTMTFTPTFGEQCGFVNYTFDDGLEGWGASEGVSEGLGVAFMETSSFIGQTLSLEAGDYILSFVTSIDDPGESTTDGGVSFIYFVNGDSDTVIGRAESNYYQVGNQVSTGIEINIPTTDSYAFLVGPSLTNVNSIKLFSVCLSSVPTEEIPDDNPDNDNGGSGGPGGWQTCGDIISPPTNLLDIGGWITFLWEHLSQIIRCIIMPPILWFAAAWAAFLNWVLFQLLPALAAFLRNLFLALVSAITGGFSGIGSQLEIAGQIANALAEIVRSIAATVDAYIRAAYYQISLIVFTYMAAPSIAPAGLPDCIVAPLDYELCAVFWVLENTFFYGQIGSLLIPAICVFIDILILFYFGNTIKRFLVDIWSMLTG